MKHDALRKLERNRALVRLKEEQPLLSWEEIGERFHITRQRAYQIYGRAKALEEAAYGATGLTATSTTNRRGA